MKRTLKRLASSILATAVLMCAVPFSAHAENTADENEYFSYNYELSGITFPSIERYFALLHNENMEEILKYCDDDALKYMKEVRDLYIPYQLRYELDKSGRVLITPTYSTIKFKLDDFTCDFRHYYNGAGNGEIKYCEQLIDNGLFSAGKIELNGNTVYFHNTPFPGEVEYVWSENEQIFALSAYSQKDNTSELCSSYLLVSESYPDGWFDANGKKYYGLSNGEVAAGEKMIPTFTFSSTERFRDYAENEKYCNAKCNAYDLFEAECAFADKYYLIAPLYDTKIVASRVQIYNTYTTFDYLYNEILECYHVSRVDRHPKI